MTTRDSQQSPAARPISRLLLCGVALLFSGAIDSVRGSFDNTAPARLESMTVHRRGDGVLILVRPEVDGLDVGWFVLDTGSSRLVIDSDLADTLNLPSVLPAAFSECDLRASMRPVTSLKLGRLTLDGPIVAALDLSRLNEGLEQDFGVRVAGTIGYPVFARSVIELDFDERGDRRVSLYEPAGYRLAHGEWQPLRIVERLPVVGGRVEDGPAGRFALDTGKAGTLSFYDSYVRANGLLEGRETRARRNLTLCGVTRELEGTIARFELAGRSFDRPTARFKLPDTPNSGGIRGVDGSIGTGLLSPFAVVFDYSGGRIALVPRRPGALADAQDPDKGVSVEPDRTYPYY